MEEQPNASPAWEAMEVQEAGNVGEVLQGAAKVSPGKGDLSEDTFEQ
jgi:hypothetical protein